MWFLCHKLCTKSYPDSGLKVKLTVPERSSLFHIQATMQQIKTLSNDLTKLILGAVQPGEEETVIVCKDIDPIKAINHQHYI